MQHAVLTLGEFSTASRFFRSVSQVPAQATGFITMGQEVAELKLVASNLRQLVPIAEAERPYIAGVASLATYYVWFAGQKIEPAYLGAFDVPLFGQGELYAIFDPRNVNDCGKALSEYTWLLVTAGSEQELGTWNEDASTAVLYGIMPDAAGRLAHAMSHWELFEQQKDSYRGIYEEDDPEFDLFEDDNELRIIEE